MPERQARLEEGWLSEDGWAEVQDLAEAGMDVREAEMQVLRWQCGRLAEDHHRRRLEELDRAAARDRMRARVEEAKRRGLVRRERVVEVRGG